jgi:uncharacterized protein (TIGR00266 family)
MKYSIIGDNLQLVNIELKHGEMVYGEAGSFVYKSENMQMKASVKGGLKESFKRLLTAESFFVAEFTPEKGTAVVGFGPSMPGKIKAILLKSGQTFLAERDAFLCADSGVTVDIQFTKIAAGIFGGEGIILQKLVGPGTVFINVFGDIIEYDLAKNQTLEVMNSHIAGFESSVGFDVTYIGSIKTAVFGGAGLMLAKLTGPGKVYLQSMTKKKFISELGIATKAEAHGSGIVRSLGNIKIGGVSLGR